MLAIALMSVGACSSGYGGTPARGGLIEVQVDVFGWNDARIGATLIDRNGRRTGWNMDRPIREIAGCTHGYGSDVGIPDETAPVDTIEQTPADTVPGGPQPTPMYHYFTIRDSAETPGLIHQGGCELRLSPVVGGKVQLTLLASGIGVKECKDTTSVWVKAGVPSRWRLSWKPAGERCFVMISKMDATRPAKPGGR
jgi:hypothetical protein